MDSQNTIVTLAIKTVQKPSPDNKIDKESGYPLKVWSINILEGRPGITQNSKALPYIKKVEFHLHETFPNSIRVVSKPPFSVSEKGWGEFTLVLVIFFNDKKIRPKEIYHDLSFQRGPEYTEKYNIELGKVSLEFLSLFNQRPKLSQKTIPSSRPTSSSKKSKKKSPEYKKPKSDSPSQKSTKPSQSSPFYSSSPLSSQHSYSDHDSEDRNSPRTKKSIYHESEKPKHPSTTPLKKPENSNPLNSYRKISNSQQNTSNEYRTSLKTNRKHSISDMSSSEDSSGENRKQLASDNIRKKTQSPSEKQEQSLKNEKLAKNKNASEGLEPIKKKPIETPTQQSNVLPKKRTDSSRPRKSVLAKLKSKTVRESSGNMSYLNSKKPISNQQKINDQVTPKTVGNIKDQNIRDSERQSQQNRPLGASSIGSIYDSADEKYRQKPEKKTNFEKSPAPKTKPSMKVQDYEQEINSPRRKIIVEKLVPNQKLSKLTSKQKISPDASINSSNPYRNDSHRTVNTPERKPGLLGDSYKPPTKLGSSSNKPPSDFTKPNRSTGLYIKPKSSKASPNHFAPDATSALLPNNKNEKNTTSPISPLEHKPHPELGPNPIPILKKSQLPRNMQSPENINNIESSNKKRNTLPFENHDIDSNDAPSHIHKRARVRGSGRFSSGSTRNSGFGRENPFENKSPNEKAVHSGEFKYNSDINYDSSGGSNYDNKSSKYDDRSPKSGGNSNTWYENNEKHPRPERSSTSEYKSNQEGNSSIRKVSDRSKIETDSEKTPISKQSPNNMGQTTIKTEHINIQPTVTITKNSVAPKQRYDLLDEVSEKISKLSKPESIQLVGLLHKYSLESLNSTRTKDNNQITSSDITNNACNTIENEGYYECDLEELSNEALSSIWTHLNSVESV
ncbi:hypothetical protein BB558_001110 [Smittium angustum]|uniref:Protein AF-9 homolog n=1 Tax=Smittium angustum TaxID=133377 RepID=A0A2U1JCB4_SMIAN|nr:hypothetical protein BB558_001110 [Smittium angustum]